MAYLKVKNRAASALAADITATATSLSVTAGEGAKFPDSGDFHITIEDEILKCTARTTDTLTVTRAQEGTTAAAHSAGKSVELRITAGVLESRDTWTANKLLKGAGVGVDPTEIDVPSSGDWEVVSEVNIGSAVDYVDFTGLDGNTDKFYELFLTITNPEAAASFFLFVNGDTTVTNYYEQYLDANGTTVVAGRSNDPTVAYAAIGERTMARVTITRDPDGYFKYLCLMSYKTGSAVILQSRAGSKTGTVANITSLRVASSVAGAIGVGSNLLLCKPRTS